MFVIFSRFKTNSDIAGTEKLAVSKIHPSFTAAAPPNLKTADVAPKTPRLMKPMSVFLVKGWSRCVAATACMLHAYEDSDSFEAGCFSCAHMADKRV